MTEKTRMERDMNDWNELACKGAPYGHVPGHNYHDVLVEVRTGRSGRVYARAIEVWGSAQERDQEHGRTVLATGEGDSVAEALRDLPRECGEGTAAGYYRAARSEALVEAD